MRFSMLIVSSLLLLPLVACTGGGDGVGEELERLTTMPETRSPDGVQTFSLPAQLVRESINPPGLIVRIDYLDLCQELVGAHVTETSSSVAVTIVGTAPQPGCLERLATTLRFIALQEPLSGRVLTILNSPSS